MEVFEYHRWKRRKICWKARHQKNALSTRITPRERRMSRSNSIKWAVMSGPKFWVGIVISWMYNLVDWPIGCRQNNDRFCVEKALTQAGLPAYALDGDNVRHGLCK
uniref:APS kinase domain-containing protein n=1 Tax=Parascaris univalens TaxID=6257 RepID=A0A915BUR7_PARUN